MQALARRLAATSDPRVPRPWPQRPVPLALVITELDVGGAEKALVRLATGLDRTRWAPTVVALGPEAPLALPLRAAGVPTECLDVDRRHPLRGVSRLARALRRIRPELAQSFLFHANVAVRLASLAVRPRPWVLGGLRVAERGKRWHLWLDHATARLSAGSICVSQGVFRFSRDIGGWPESRLTVIPNGVETAPHDEAARVGLRRAQIGLPNVPERATLALYVGRLDPQKGLATLIEAADRLLAAGLADGREWHLALAGDGSERAALRALAASRPALAGHVHWLGHRGDIPALLHAADHLVLPSLWEGMPNAVLEAMAARRAVVATRVEGTEELVIAGASGWLVPPGDPVALANALREAAADPDRLRRLGAAGRARVEAEFGSARVVDAHERLWAGVLGLALPD